MPRCLNPRCQVDYPPGAQQCTNPFCLCLLPEALVAGRYRIETLIGMGGMGVVYRASDTFEMTQVALKVLSLKNSTVDPQVATERFRREARYAHQLKHRNIVPVNNFGQDGDLLYLEMPLMTGGTLKALLKPEMPLPTQQAIGYIEDMAAAIDVIHEHPQQIVHRDVKPSNLLIAQDDGRLVLADFGIARAMQKEKALTQHGLSLGTEHYIAPEQEQGKAQPASDIYAMSVVAYQMLTGLLPIQAVIKTHAAIIPLPSSLNHALPPEVDACVMRAMDIEPSKRYAKAGDFAHDLKVALAGNCIAYEPTIADLTVVTSSANVITRTVMPENACSRCGRENRSNSRYCRHCGQSLDATSPAIGAQCEVSYESDTGSQRQVNEDMLLLLQGLCVNLQPPPHPFAIFAIADGLRGLQGRAALGHEASRLAIETVADTLVPLLSDITRSYSRGTPVRTSITPNGSLTYSGARPTKPLNEEVLEHWLADAMHQANQVVYHCNADYDAQMASTLTVALLYKYRFYVANVGDSRVYHFNKKSGLRCLTRDHTLAANLVEANLLEPEELYSSAKRNQHYRTLGQNYMIQIDITQHEVEAGDLLVLCTDGVWHMLRDERLEELLRQPHRTEDIANLLVQEANQAGGEGNASAIVINVL
ncbi:protein kinase domain-containing protein [Ktedonospora formicarum]|uniref:non-specific serine/threonine protein kinase n=1 Tax=Ktedonospora formicarum TaxID=2778364 RepID=A0A8J3MT92_9CHLR|nr:protein kinase [Ktedonospora formicarum]GHO45388.1 hypothetical protein KSX_35510 [Ktedonospora formicarum]